MRRAVRPGARQKARWPAALREQTMQLQKPDGLPVISVVYFSNTKSEIDAGGARGHTFAMRTNMVNTSPRPWARRAALVFLAALLTALPGFPARAQSAERLSLRVGLYQNEPKIYASESGEARGIFPDLLGAVADAEQWDLHFVPGTWQQCLERLDRGELDLMPDVCFTEERNLKYALNREPVLSDWFGIYAREEMSVSSILDLDGKRVALLKGSVQAELFEKMVEGFGLSSHLIVADDYDSAAELVRGGLADAIIVNRFGGGRLRTRYNLRDTAIIFNPTHLHFAAPAGSRRMVLDAIDRHLVKWKAEPDSIYYRTLKENTGDAPAPFIPSWFWKALGGAGGVLLFAGVVILLLKWQVNRKTAELRQRTLELEDAMESLKAAQDRAIQQERLHALGQMASGVAHDFNNMLTVIMGWSNLLLRTTADAWNKENVREGLEKIEDAARGGSRIVERLRGFYRQRLGLAKLAPVSPGAVARRAIELMKPRWSDANMDKPIRIETAIDDSALVLADEAEIQESLVNLIGNAIDAMPAGGTLAVSVSSEDGQAVSVSVKDNGVGMSEEVLQHSMNAFFTTKGAGGTGMGLPMVLGICERYGGRVDIKSKPGAGTTATMVFPAIADKARNPAGTTPAARRVRPLKILVVDDEPVTLDALVNILSMDGHQVDCETNPRQAPERFARGKYDLVIMDWLMPGMSGIQLFERIARANARVPVIMITGSREDAAISARERGFLTLRKPLQRSELARAFLELGFAAED